jgi:hypothetical protein
MALLLAIPETVRAASTCLLTVPTRHAAGGQGNTVATENGGNGTLPGSHPTEQLSNTRRPTADAAEQIAELSKLVLRQQNQLGDLSQQVELLQAAICKVDPDASGCKR